MSAYEPFPVSESSSEPTQDDTRLASRGRRFWAWLLDLLFMVLIAGLVVGAIALAFGADEDLAIGLIYGGYVLVLLLYYPLTMQRDGARNGQTFGKQLLKVRVVTAEGVPVTFWRAARRDVLGTTAINVVSGGLYSLVDYPFAFFDKRRQCVHDKIGATFVFRADAARDPLAPDDGPEPPRTPPPSPPPAAEQPRNLWAPPSRSNEYDEINRAFGR
ncbi:MAG TPA: RDD family protein [Conexibacter sp.]|nr:RDD family protein [Conexibacter sp.]